MELACHAPLGSCVIQLEKKVPQLLAAPLVPIQREEQVVAAPDALLVDTESAQVLRVTVPAYVIQDIIVLLAQLLQLQCHALQAIIARLEQERFARQVNPLVLRNRDVCKRMGILFDGTI